MTSSISTFAIMTFEFDIMGDGLDGEDDDGNVFDVYDCHGADYHQSYNTGCDGNRAAQSAS